MRRSYKLLPIVVLCIAVFGCSQEKKHEITDEIKPAGPTKAPDEFRVKFETSKGPFEVQVHRGWAPRGADRFYELLQQHFLDDARFFRVIRNFVVQFGINKDPQVSALWSQLRIVDDPPAHPNARGTLTFAKRGPNTRTTQIFINLKDNDTLQSSGFAPFGEVAGDGMSVVDQLFGGYGETIPRGNGPDPNKIIDMGNEYLDRNFPKLDYIKTTKLE